MCVVGGDICGPWGDVPCAVPCVVFVWHCVAPRMSDACPGAGTWQRPAGRATARVQRRGDRGERGRGGVGSGPGLGGESRERSALCGVAPLSLCTVKESCVNTFVTPSPRDRRYPARCTDSTEARGTPSAGVRKTSPSIARPSSCLASPGSCQQRHPDRKPCKASC